MSHAPVNQNLALLGRAAEKLAPLLDRIVFVGGCVSGLLVSDPAAAPVRPTIDVDAVLEIYSYTEFTQLETRMNELGFRHREDSLICRWFADDLVLDLMPVDPAILGFSNKWYGPSVDHATTIRLEKQEIRIITAPYFLATKLEAFRGRGKNDFRVSRDLEDIITVIDGRPELTEEVALSEASLQEYLQEEFAALLANAEFRDALPGHLLPDTASQQRIGIVLGRIQQIIDQA
ncbi:MAG: hypothetical protein ACRD3B_20570 [Candidatus Sulfotelmatobacter sp.]